MKTLLRQTVLFLFAGVAGGAIVLATGSGGTTTHTITVVSTPGPVSASTAAELHTSGLSARQIYQQDAPGVVVVKAQTTTQTNTFFGPQTQPAEALGSGFVIDRAGHILTNAHVVVNSKDVTVGFAGPSGTDTTYQAKVLGVDKATDIAVLQPTNLPPGSLDPLPLGTVKNVQVGDQVVAIGNPLGQERTITEGIISAVGRSIESLAPGQQIANALQTDAAINHGNSGGPLINTRGQVIGITSQILSDGSGPQSGNIGIGFAIPIDTARTVADQIIATGHATHTYLGIRGVSLTPAVAKQLNIQSSHGVLVDTVVPGSPAAKAGLRGGTTTATIGGYTFPLGGDVITAVNNKPIIAFTDLTDAISSRKPGDTVTLTLLRSGKTVTVQATLAARAG
jgi:S1-C subfamily serine protease